MKVKDVQYGIEFDLPQNYSFNKSVLYDEDFLQIYNPSKIILYKVVDLSKVSVEFLNNLILKIFLLLNINDCLNSDVKAISEFVKSIVDKIMDYKGKGVYGKKIGLKGNNLVSINPMEAIKPLLTFYRINNINFDFNVSIEFVLNNNILDIVVVLSKGIDNSGFNFFRVEKVIKEFGIRRVNLMQSFDYYLVLPVNANILSNGSYEISIEDVSFSVFYITLLPSPVTNYIKIISPKGIFEFQYGFFNDIFQLISSILSNYFGMALWIENVWQLNVPDWSQVVANFTFASLARYGFSGRIGNWRFLSEFDFTNYGVCYEIQLSLLKANNPDYNLFQNLKNNGSLDLQTATKLVGNLIKKREQVQKTFSVDYNARRQISDIFYRDAMDSIRHHRTMYEKTRQTHEYIMDLQRQNFYEEMRAGEAYTKAFSAAINNETYVKDDSGYVYRVPASSGFENLEYYQKDDTIFSVGSRDYETKDYLKAFGYKKMKEDLFGFVYEE